MNIRPMHDNIVVTQIEKNVSRGGIHLLQHKDDGLVKEIVFGVVKAVGPGKINKRGQRDTMWELKEGDVIGFSPVGKKPALDGMFMIKRDAVIGVCQQKETAHG
jgi:co-chaperonin GroES (HSP10)